MQRTSVFSAWSKHGTAYCFGEKSEIYAIVQANRIEKIKPMRLRLAHFIRKERAAARLKESRQTLGEWLKGRKHV